MALVIKLSNGSVVIPVFNSGVPEIDLTIRPVGRSVVTQVVKTICRGRYL